MRRWGTLRFYMNRCHLRNSLDTSLNRLCETKQTAQRGFTNTLMPFCFLAPQTLATTITVLFNSTVTKVDQINKSTSQGLVNGYKQSTHFITLGRDILRGSSQDNNTSVPQLSMCKP